jgi:SAM-dependent methyltransferase
MPRAKIPFVDFYSRHGIIPTRQDISNLRRHIERRESLYRQLGLPPGFFRGSSVLEFGPGSGHNSVVTGTLKPARYLLVDGNPPSIHSTREQLNSHCPDLVFEIREASISKFETKERFDLVLAEGLVPTQHNPNAFLKYISRFVAPGGVIVFTTMDAISLLPEMLRRWMAWRLTHQVQSLDEKLKILVRFFEQDVKALPGMSRPIEDWILDQILHPWSGPAYSIPEATKALGKRWSLLGCSPRFVADWRWYKNIYGAEVSNPACILSSYCQHAHNLLDYRYISAPLPVGENRHLEKAAQDIYSLVFKQEKSGTPVSGAVLARHVNKIAAMLANISPETSKSLLCFAKVAVERDLAKADLGAFRALWGRGQQYLSFVRL